MQRESLKQRFDTVIAAGFARQNTQHQVDLGVRELGAFAGPLAHGHAGEASFAPVTAPMLSPSRAKYMAPNVVMGIKLKRW